VLFGDGRWSRLRGGPEPLANPPLPPPERERAERVLFGNEECRGLFKGGCWAEV
jgi:hypothetical protein